MESRPPWTFNGIGSSLLQAPPFIDCDVDHISGQTQFKDKNKYKCRNKPSLLTALALALHNYFDMDKIAQEAPTPERLRQRAHEAVMEEIPLIRAYLRLRKSRRLSKAARAQIPSWRVKTLLKYAAYISHILESLTLDDYTEITRYLRSSRHQCTLEEEMRQAFDTYGPRWTHRHFPRLLCSGAHPVVL
jgi:hypothetical protein